jgi:HlyD family secretion protein
MPLSEKDRRAAEVEERVFCVGILPGVSGTGYRPSAAVRQQAVALAQRTQNPQLTCGARLATTPCMDRPVDPLARRKRLAWNIALPIFIVLVLVAVVGWAPRWLRPTLSRGEFRTSRVDMGTVEATITASGTVVPEFEAVLSSPLDARVVKILHKPGSVVRRGDAILDLDVSGAQLTLEKLRQDISLKANQQEIQKLELENKLTSLRSQVQLKAVDVKSLGVEVSKQRTLHAEGLNTEEQLRVALVNEEKAKIELSQLQDSIRGAGVNTRAQIEGLQLEMNKLRSEVDQARRELERATTKSDRDGVLTWVVSEEGALVRKGDVVARIADLSSFRVDATISDVHANRLSAGLPARIRVNETVTLDGFITAVLPTIKDGAATAQIRLEDKASRLLRANLRVDVFVVTAQKHRVLRVKRGSFAAEGRQDVFVVRGSKAVRTAVQLGISNFEYVEIVAGLMEGDEVITTETQDYMHLKEVSLTR